MNKLVEEAPYHPGYEDAVVDGIVTNWITNTLPIANAISIPLNKSSNSLKTNTKNDL